MDARKERNSRKTGIILKAENIPPMRDSEDEEMGWMGPLWVRDDARASLMEKIAHGDKIECVKL